MLRKHYCIEENCRKNCNYLKLTDNSHPFLYTEHMIYCKLFNYIHNLLWLKTTLSDGKDKTNAHLRCNVLKIFSQHDNNQK